MSGFFVIYSESYETGENIMLKYENLLAHLLEKYTDLNQGELIEAIETPPDPGMGHLAFPCFRLAKAMKKAPPLIAREITDALLTDKPDWINTIAATGPYVNIFLNKAAFAEIVIGEIQKKSNQYGSTGIGAGKKVVIDYSSPNIAKHFHVGHLGSTIIGKSLDNIMRFLGYKVTSINHLGDWGTQFGRLITAYLKWGSKEEIEKTEIDGLEKLYVRFHKEADGEPSLYDEARAWVVKMQNGDEEGLSLWKWFVDLSLREYDRLYKRMGISFDLFRGESHYNGMLDDMAKLIESKGLLVESEGAKIVDLEAYDMPPCLILRSDGGTLYPTRDIAAAMNRHEEFDFDLCLYVTGQEQQMHFAQWFKVLELMGYEWSKGLVHIPYGMFRFEQGKISSRRGEVIKMELLLDEAVEKTRAIIEEKNPHLKDKDTVAEQVGIGAIVFNKLYNNRIKDTVFSFEQMLNFEGETGPYVQYTHARACSILEKAGWDQWTECDFSLLQEDEAFETLRCIYDFPARVEEAAERYEPFFIARQLVALAQAFNSFYHRHMVLVEDEKLRAARLALTAAVRQVLATGLQLLGIAAPTSM
jgi:arginyl-tRNA synthetase